MVDQAGRREVVGREEKGSGWGLPAALVLLALVLVLAHFRTRPPAPKPVDVPAGEFSAGRAQEVLKTLLGDGAPRPPAARPTRGPGSGSSPTCAGSATRRRCRQSFACERFGNCAQVVNVVARLEGREPGKAILLAAHYDSVPAGPGVGDDLAGVATVLEVARILKTGPPPKNPVIFLLDDGEELGLLGAEAFAESPAASEVGAVVNLEGRGNAGPEPDVRDQRRGRLDGLPLRRPGEPPGHQLALRPPSTSYMPNDTDLTVFKRRGVPGLNFAFIGNPTALPLVAGHLREPLAGSLQHHGDNALAAVRGLAEADLASAAAGQGGVLRRVPRWW